VSTRALTCPVGDRALEDHLGSASRGRSRVVEDVISENPFYESGEEDDVDGDDVEDEEDSEDEDDPNVPSIIPDPGRATPKERRWLTKMSEGKSSWIAKRFEAQVSPQRSPVHFLMAVTAYINILTENARMTRSSTTQTYPASNFVKCSTTTMNT
jgi:hypothetical protein